ncbi:hypothetical protein NE865_13374 [Phthorimaea operculella]|nr:hypothetical protein NE865_13374 [Phthorimaea operculella]
MRHVHSSIAIAGEDVRMSDILFNFYSYQVPDELEPPENICISCVHQLTLTHSFKILIFNTAKTLAENAAAMDSVSENYDEDEYSDTGYKPEVDLKPEKTVIKRYKTQTKTYRSKQVQNKKPLRKMIIKRHSYPEKQLYCVECKAEFRTESSLKEHCKNNHTPQNATGRECEYCYDKFEDFKELVIHRKLHLKPYLCLTCWNGFYEENDFTNHTCQPNQSRRSKGAEKVLRQCDQCGKSYPAGYIKVHMMTHGTELKYSCKYCPKKFKVANGLNSHVLWNHKRTRNHKCDVCGASFISASAKSTHIRKNHLKEKKYGCESCAKRFFSKSELQRHMLTHTGVKNFHCHLCDKSYQTRYGLNVHLKSHTNINSNVNVLSM